MKNIITIEDMTQEVYYINPRNVAYIKEKKNIGTSSWKIALVNGESIITQNKRGIEVLIKAFTKEDIDTE